MVMCRPVRPLQVFVTQFSSVESVYQCSLLDFSWSYHLEARSEGGGGLSVTVHGGVCVLKANSSSEAQLFFHQTTHYNIVIGKCLPLLERSLKTHSHGSTVLDLFNMFLGLFS